MCRLKSPGPVMLMPVMELMVLVPMLMVLVPTLMVLGIMMMLGLMMMILTLMVLDSDDDGVGAVVDNGDATNDATSDGVGFSVLASAVSTAAVGLQPVSSRICFLIFAFCSTISTFCLFKSTIARWYLEYSWFFACRVRPIWWAANFSRLSVSIF